MYVVISSSRFEFKASAPPDSADYYADHMFRPRSKVWSDKRRTFCFRGFFFHKFPNNTSWLNKICLCLTRVIWESPTLRWFSPLFHPKKVKQKIEWNKGLAHLKYITIISEINEMLCQKLTEYFFVSQMFWNLFKHSYFTNVLKFI